MKTIRRYVFLNLLMILAANGQQTDSLNLDQVISEVLKHNPLIEQSLEKISAANAQIAISHSGDYPYAAAEISYNRIGPVIQFQIPNAKPVSLYPADNYDAHVGAQYTVYDFGKREVQTELAQNGLEQSENSLKTIRNELAYQTIKIFYSILFLQKNIHVLDQEIAALKNHLDVAQKKAQTGSATSFDVLTTRVRVSNAENQKIDLQTSMEKNRLLLKSLMGIKDGESISITGDFNDAFVTLPKNDSLIVTAMKNRQEMKLAANTVKHYEIALRLASLSDNAQLKINGMVGIKNGYIPNLNEPKFNWLAGVGLDIPLFDGYATHFKEQEVQAHLAAAKAFENEVKRQVSVDVEQALQEVIAQKKKLDAADLQLKEANEAVTLATKQYEAGVVTNLELLDAHAAQAQSELQKARVLYNLVVC
ncbi:MAG: TolC family protein, partial [Calditrichaeota bacterium]|nr:TolC family protein [Calditrichota bacterium]